MKKTVKYSLCGGVLILALGLVYISVSSSGKPSLGDKNSEVKKDDSMKVAIQQQKKAEKLQVFLFHNTQRCFSCIMIGKFAKNTIEQSFADELGSGKIEFREINIDLPENKEIADKFKATGSALFLNAIVDGQDNIKEDAQVWRLVSDEKTFSDYLFGKIKQTI